VFRSFADYRMIVYALALIIVMILRPQGIMGVHELWELAWWRKHIAPRLPGGKKSRTS
jgi:branched-chain amino acid transport system permease protein